MAHHGAPRNPRLTRLLKKRSRVAPQSSPVVAHHRQTPGVSESNQGVGQHDTGRGDKDELVAVRQRTGGSEDLPKVLATVVNVIDGDYQTSTKDDAGVTMPSRHPLIEASLAAIPAYSLPTADTPTLTSSSIMSTASATSSAHTSAITSRPLISSSRSSSSAVSSSATSSPRPSASSSLVSFPITSSPSRVTRSSTKTTSSITLTTTSSSSISSTISSITPTTTNYNPIYTNSIAGVGVGGVSGGTGSPGPTSTGSNPSQPPTSSVPPTTGKIVGGVVGSVAGAVTLVLLALFLFRRRTAMRMSPEALPASEGAGTGAAPGGGSSQSAEMTSRFSRDSILTAAYFAPAFMKKWRDSSHTDSTLVSSGGGSERGFQKISGRKIPSVLTSGGDGYGGGYETVSPTVSEPSMTPGIPGSPVIPRSPSQPPPSTPFGMPLDVSYTREAEETDPGVIMHGSPTRTSLPRTVTVASGAVPINIPRAHSQSPRALSPSMPHRPDTIGRSHPSFDGSRGSRFTEGL